MANPTEISPDLHKAETIASSAESIGRLQSWKTILGTCNLPKGMEKPDFVSRWMIISRACVFSMTLFSGLIGGMLAVWIALRTGENVLELDWLNFVLAIIAIVICHPVNNMLN
ncbi:MAG TPA: hypothetical protein VJ044_17800, partial [Candidatus Hodarchaeales archaeon]|nr:hypothetical protein [Candidatus Hodarchaeales archaeon]